MIKRQFFLTFCLLVLAAGTLTTNAQAGGKGFYPDGQTKWEYLFQDGEISEAKWYNEAGQLISREIYASGQPEKTEGYRPDGSLEWQVRQLENGHQEVTRFDESSKITARYQTVDGHSDGEYTTFFADGQAKQTVTYRQGLLDGSARTFFNSGQVEHEFSYSNGEVDGTYRTFSADGKLLSEYTFSAGQLQ
jgi:antitoxin component YwqK of YwqJK toxin-antitoxin module